MPTVYIIRAGATGLVKIGFSSNARNRIGQLRADEATPFRVLRLLEGGKPEERALHARFAHLRRWGERFTYAPEMMAGDLGLPNLPVPIDLCRNHSLRVPEVGAGVPDLLAEMVEALGGPDAIARRLGVAPFRLRKRFGLVRRRYWSALVVMLRDAGRTEFSLAALDVAAVALDRKCADGRALMARQRAGEAAHWDAEAERRWIVEHGRDAAWWPLRPEQAAPNAGTRSLFAYLDPEVVA